MILRSSQIESIVDALAAIRMPAQPEEYDIHTEVARVLDAASLEYAHEYRLGPRCRIDFAVGRVGIEVKKGKPEKGALMKQLARYLEYDALDAAVVVVQRAVALPERIHGKPVHVVSLNRLWGVALP